jgi:hypothetical protein
MSQAGFEASTSTHASCAPLKPQTISRPYLVCWFLPHRKHVASHFRDQFVKTMRDVTVVCSEWHTRQAHTFGGQDVVIRVKARVERGTSVAYRIKTSCYLNCVTSGKDMETYAVSVIIYKLGTPLPSLMQVLPSSAQPRLQRGDDLYLLCSRLDEYSILIWMIIGKRYELSPLCS